MTERQDEIIERSVSPDGGVHPFLYTESDLLPDGVDFDDLTDEEQQTLADVYRFAPIRPGRKQGLSHLSNRYSKMVFAGYKL